MSMLLSQNDKFKDFLYGFYRRVYTKFWWRYPWLFRPPRTPHIVSLELTNDCNQACPHCPRFLESREIGYMNVRLFKKIVDEISSYSWCFLRIVGLGEPAMHADIEEILDYLADKSLKIEFTTNGTFLMRFPPEQILNWHIDILGISIDGYDATSYSYYRPKGNYNLLREKIIKLYLTRQKMRRRFPKIRIRNVAFPKTTYDQIRVFTDDWLPFADIVTFNTLIQKSLTETTQKFERCTDILFTMHVRWDGRVPLCGYQLWCGDTEWLGDLHNCALTDLWCLSRLLELRKHHTEGDFTKIDFCKRCFYTQRRKDAINITRTHDKHKNPVLSQLYRFAFALSE
ncbi:MAG: radical SAM protein [Promethearchaeota archaeon]